MEIMTIETRDDGITKVNLSGKLDIIAAQKIDMPFNIVAGSKRKVIVDLEQVSFIASIGIRTIVLGAKTIKAKGGRIALLKPTPDVEQVLVSSGIDTIISIFHDLDVAVDTVLQ